MNHSESDEEHLHKIEHFTQEVTTTNRITAGGQLYGVFDSSCSCFACDLSFFELLLFVRKLYRKVVLCCAKFNL